MTEATIYSSLKQEKIDRGEVMGSAPSRPWSLLLPGSASVSSRRPPVSPSDDANP